MITANNLQHALAIVNDVVSVTLATVTSQRTTSCLVHPLSCNQQRSFHGVHQLRKRERELLFLTKVRCRSAQLSRKRRHVNVLADG